MRGDEAPGRGARCVRRARGLRGLGRTGLVAAATLALAGAGCAPHLVRVAELAPAMRAERYRAALRQREARGAAVDAQILIWAEVPVGTRFPGVEGRLLLASPDAFRLRVASVIGTAIDLGARGESLSAYVPSRRRGLSVDAIHDSLGVVRPGALVFRALAAAWRPPDDAWDGATWRDTLLAVRWLEGADTLAVAVGSHGLPAWATLTRADGAVFRVDYRAWDGSQGLAWPERFDVAELGGAFRLSCKVTRVRFPARPDPLRLTVPIPAAAVQLTLAELRRALQRLGSL